MALTDGTMIKKFHVALFLNSGTTPSPVWTQIKKSTDNTINGNPETKVFDYIVDESPTTEIDRYAPSLSQPITMYKGEDDFEFLFAKFFDQATGDDAHSEILIVFYNADETTSYKAWKSDCIISFDSMNPVDSTITATITFNGTTDKGTAAVTNGVPVFSSTTVTEFIITVTVKDDVLDVEAATVVCGGVEKTTPASGEVTFTLINGETYSIGAIKGVKKASDTFVASSGTTTMTLEIA